MYFYRYSIVRNVNSIENMMNEVVMEIDMSIGHRDQVPGSTSDVG